jgi:hypothetical protein
VSIEDLLDLPRPDLETGGAGSLDAGTGAMPVISGMACDVEGYGCP